MTIGVESVQRSSAGPDGFGSARAGRDMRDVATTVAALDGTCGLTRERIGGKAWSVNHMRALGLPVPPAFALTTEAWAEFRAGGGDLGAEIWTGVVDGIAALGQETGRRFGSAEHPLLVSVRSGAAVSMPGMMDTVLNLGMNDAVEQTLAAETRNPAYASDTRRRFVGQYREIVLGAGNDLTGDVPGDPWQQLRGAIIAVFRSWDSERARTYRRNQGVSDELGTAVTVQAMVFGNLDERSGTGVLFSRNPNTGERPVFGEWLPGGQGEDVVSGRTTPRPLGELAATMPEVHAELIRAAEQLERDGRDIQDVEFTVESGRLWLLQSRAAKRSARAALRAAVAMADEGLIDHDEALRRVTVDQLRTVLRPASGVDSGQPPLAAGESACPGLASGVVVTDPDEAEARSAAGERVVLARTTTSPDDLHGMIAAQAIVTELGGATSHAALVSRELGRPCVVGCGPGVVAALAARMVTVDGGAGLVWSGEVTGKPVADSVLDDVGRLATWAGVDPADLSSVLARAEVSATPTRSADTTAPGQVAEMSPTPAEDLAQDVSNASAAAIASRQVSELAVLRLIGIKGRVQPGAVAASLDIAESEATTLIDDFVTRGLCAATAVGVRLTPPGREQVDNSLAHERADVDPHLVAAAYDEFCEFNAELKAVITAWQMKDASTVNDHGDSTYDASVLARLTALHHRVVPLVERIGAIAPRLLHYPDRLARAVEGVNGGDHSWVARPIMDSYHTVWFELHEDLIGLCGLSRAAEAAAGRAH